jgi:hypothetical protein
MADSGGAAAQRRFGAAAVGLLEAALVDGSQVPWAPWPSPGPWRHRGGIESPGLSLLLPVAIKLLANRAL